MCGITAPKPTANKRHTSKERERKIARRTAEPVGTYLDSDHKRERKRERKRINTHKRKEKKKEHKFCRKCGRMKMAGGKNHEKKGGKYN